MSLHLLFHLPGISTPPSLLPCEHFLIQLDQVSGLLICEVLCRVSGQKQYLCLRAICSTLLLTTVSSNYSFTRVCLSTGTGKPGLLIWVTWWAPEKLSIPRPGLTPRNSDSKGLGWGTGIYAETPAGDSHVQPVLRKYCDEKVGSLQRPCLFVFFMILPKRPAQCLVWLV